jgi:hypothetical protein
LFIIIYFKINLFVISDAAHTIFSFQKPFLDAPCFQGHHLPRVPLRFTRGY